MSKNHAGIEVGTTTEELAELRAKVVARHGEKYVRKVEENCSIGQQWREHMREIYEANVTA